MVYKGYAFLAKIRALCGRNTGNIQVVVILSSTLNLLSVIGLFTKQFNNALNLHKITKIRVKSQKHGRYTGDFPQRPLYTGMPI